MMNDFIIESAKAILIIGIGYALGLFLVSRAKGERKKCLDITRR